MTILILGLAIFLGTHSIRIFANDWRAAQRSRFGEAAWKAGFALASALGLGLTIWGFGMARQEPVALWAPAAALRHGAALLTLISFILIAAAYVPRNSIRARLHHPMTLGVGLWAVAHLLANGTLADLILFASFLLWAIFCFLAARRRDLAERTHTPAGTLSGTVGAVAAGTGAWVLFAFWLHGLLIGIHPFLARA